MNENMFENFSSSSSSNSDNKTLSKAMPGVSGSDLNFNPSNNQEAFTSTAVEFETPAEVKSEPFTAPVIDFFADMPVVDETFIKPIAMPITEEVNNNLIIDIPVNDTVTPVFDMPNENIMSDFNSIISSEDKNVETVVNNEVSNNINNPVQEVIQNSNTNDFLNSNNLFPPIENNVNSVQSVNEFVNSNANTNTMFAPIETPLNNDNVVSTDFSNIEIPINNNIKFEDNVKVATEIDTPVINTMSSGEIVNNFNSIINDELNPLNAKVEPYKEVSDNTFSSIFANVPGDDKTFFTPEEKKNVNEERTELIEPIRKEKKVKKTLIPKGYGMGIAIFVVMYAFVLNLDKVAEYLNRM